MRRSLTTLSIIVTAVLGFQVYVQSEAAVSQSGDLCGGTGGNGQIVRMGSNEFTIKRNDGSNQIVHLADLATIETSAGTAAVSDLNIGDRVTLVGGPNRDGSFTADTVVVCSGTQEIGAQDSGTGIAIRNKNPETYELASDIVNAATILLAGLVWLGIIAFLKLKVGKSFVYIFLFTIFYLYLYKVLDITLFQYQSLLLLQYFVPDLILNGFKDGTNVNLIPLATLTLEDMKTSLLNILMLLPFGFGLPFISNLRFKRVVIAGFFFSVAIECLQLVTGFMANTTFRVADINDLIFNTAGVAIGYVLFVAFIRLYRLVFPNGKAVSNPILRYIAERPQAEKELP